MKFSQDHEWIKADGDKGQLGVTVFASEQLGDIVFVELPEVGDKLTKDETFGSIESVKTVSDLVSPITGEVIGINEAIDDKPELVNEDATGKGWLLEVKLDDVAELDAMLDKAAYDAICK